MDIISDLSNFSCHNGDGGGGGGGGTLKVAFIMLILICLQ